MWDQARVIERGGDEGCGKPGEDPLEVRGDRAGGEPDDRLLRWLR